MSGDYFRTLGVPAALGRPLQPDDHRPGSTSQVAIATAPPELPYDPPRVWLLDGRHGLGTLREAATGPLVVLFAGVGALMLAACANIAGLLLARGNARQREIATRLALGAPRSRVVRQLVTESLVLSGVGGLIGLALANALSGLGPSLLSQFMPTLFGADRALNVAPGIDARVLAFSMAAAVLSGLIFGITPALRATQVDLIATIRQTTTGPEKSAWLLTSGQAMVAAQTALAVLLLNSAGLFVRTVINLRAADLGFRAEGLLYAKVEPRSGAMPQEQRARFFEDATKRLEQLPGVIAVSAAGVAPMGGAASLAPGVETIPICTRDAIANALPPLPTAYNAVLPATSTRWACGWCPGAI